MFDRESSRYQSDGALSGFANILCSFRTTPVIPGAIASKIAEAAVDAAFTNPALAAAEYDAVRESARRHKILTFGEAPGFRGDKWWVLYSSNEDVARIFIGELLRVHNDVATRELTHTREERSAEAEQLRKELEEQRAQIDDLRKQADVLGVAGRQSGEIYEEIGELQRQIRRIDVDLAGLTARVATIKQRLEDRSVSAISVEALEAVKRMQIEAEITMAEKLAQQKSMQDQIAKLQQGNTVLSALTKAVEARNRLQSKLAEHEKQDAELTAQLEALKTQPCEVVRNRVSAGECR